MVTAIRFLLSERPHIIAFFSRRSEVYCVWVVNESTDNYHFNFIFVKLWYFVFYVLSCRPYLLQVVQTFILSRYRSNIFGTTEVRSPHKRRWRRNNPLTEYFRDLVILLAARRVCIKRIDPSLVKISVCLVSRVEKRLTLFISVFCTN